MGAHNRLGVDGETAAAAYLERHGYQILDRNFRCPFGELDLVAEADGTVVFVEVKTRSSLRAGLPAEAVDERRLRRTRLAAVAWLRANRPARRVSGTRCRFDVLALVGAQSRGYAITHYQQVHP